MPSNPEQMMQSVAASLPQRTGKTLEQWIELVQLSGIDPLDQNSVRKWLKSEHAILQNSQWTIADAAARAAGWIEPTLEDCIQKQYSGAKAPLKPLFDKLRTMILSLADDISEEGRSTYIPYCAKRQFIAIAAASKSRIDIGMRFTAPPHSDLLQVANAPGQATHKVSISQIEDINSDLFELITVAFQQNSK
jgi:predicted transport protein